MDSSNIMNIMNIKKKSLEMVMTSTMCSVSLLKKVVEAHGVLYVSYMNYVKSLSSAAYILIFILIMVFFQFQNSGFFSTLHKKSFTYRKTGLKHFTKYISYLFFIIFTLASFVDFGNIQNLENDTLIKPVDNRHLLGLIKSQQKQFELGKDDVFGMLDLLDSHCQSNFCSPKTLQVSDKLRETTNLIFNVQELATSNLMERIEEQNTQQTQHTQHTQQHQNPTTIVQITPSSYIRALGAPPLSSSYGSGVSKTQRVENIRTMMSNLQQLAREEQTKNVKNMEVMLPDKEHSKFLYSLEEMVMKKPLQGGDIDVVEKGKISKAGKRQQTVITAEFLNVKREKSVLMFVNKVNLGIQDLLQELKLSIKEDSQYQKKGRQRSIEQQKEQKYGEMTISQIGQYLVKKVPSVRAASGTPSNTNILLPGGKLDQWMDYAAATALKALFVGVDKLQEMSVLSPESAKMIDKFAMDVVVNKEEVAKLVLQNGFKSGIGFQESTKNNILDLMNNFSSFKVNDKLLNPVLVRNVFKILKRPPTMTEVFYAITPTSFKNLISYFFFYTAFQFHDFVTVPVIAYLLHFLTVFVLFSSSRGLKLTQRIVRNKARTLLHR